MIAVFWRPMATMVLTVAALSARAEGSKNLTPGSKTRNASGNLATGENDFVGYLQHNDNNGATVNSAQFLKRNRPAEQRLYTYLKNAETLYYGVRRVGTNNGVANSRLRLQLKYLTAGNVEVTVKTSYLEANAATAAGTVNLAANQVGLIATPQEATVGPRYDGTAPAGATAPLSGRGRNVAD